MTLAAVVTGVGLAACGSSLARPPGQWGNVLACLERHPLFAVYDATSDHASSPNATTTKLDVWQNFKGVDLANVSKFATAAVAKAVATSAASEESQVGDPTDNVGAIGPVEYLFILGGDQNPPHALADPQNQVDITNCIEEAYPSATATRSATATKQRHSPQASTVPSARPGSHSPLTATAPRAASTGGTLTSEAWEARIKTIADQLSAAFLPVRTHGHEANTWFVLADKLKEINSGVTAIEPPRVAAGLTTAIASGLSPLPPEAEGIGNDLADGNDTQASQDAVTLEHSLSSLLSKISTALQQLKGGATG